MIETVVKSIRFNRFTNSGWFCSEELTAIAICRSGSANSRRTPLRWNCRVMEAPRPLPYDLKRALLSELGATVERVVISDLSMDVFYALSCRRAIGGRNGRARLRPSDAIALAVRSGSPIFVEDSVMERASV